MSSSFQIEICSDHFQFFLSDKIEGPLLDTGNLWDRDGNIATVDGAPEFVSVKTCRFGGKTRILVDIVEFALEDGCDWYRLGDLVSKRSLVSCCSGLPRWTQSKPRWYPFGLGSMRGGSTHVGRMTLRTRWTRMGPTSIAWCSGLRAHEGQK